MSPEPIRVLLVDDSAVMRGLVSRSINAEPDLEVIASAANGRLGIEQLVISNPDVVVLDLNMPEMDGLEALPLMKAMRPDTPVVMFSTATEGGAEVTLKALSLGASDYATKPTNSANVDDGVRQLREDLIAKLRRCGSRSHGAAANTSHQQCGPASLPATPTRAVAIVTSLGGPAALEAVMPSIGAALRIPIFVVQHMVQRFTGDLAAMLDHCSPTTVLAAEDGMGVLPGHCYLAPGSQTMVVERVAGRTSIRCSESVAGHGPSADALISSLAELYQSGLLVVILTGDGDDGVAGCITAAAAGGHVVVQDQASSVAWGTPAAVIGAGVANGSLKIEQVGGFIADATQTAADGSHRDGPNNERSAMSTATASAATRTASDYR